MHAPFFNGAATGRERKNSTERGAALLLFTVMLMLVVLPLIGLAIDGGVAYFAHARLSSAVDAAALAGARSLNVGQDLPSQQANAQTVATNYFYANFPSGFLGSSNVQFPTPVIQQTSYHTITVQAQASATVPLYFLGMLGHPTAQLNASATTSRRDVNVMLTLDRSGSMIPVCEVLKSDAEDFVNRFVDGRDRLGLVTFMGSASVHYQATKYFKSQSPSLNDTIKQLQCGGNTGSAEALTLAHQQIVAGAEPGALNVIVFFTDGVPNGFTANFTLLSGKPCPTTAYIADGGGMYSDSSQAISSVATPMLSNCPGGSLNQLNKSYQGIPDADAYGDSATGYTKVARNAAGLIAFSTQNSDAVSINAADDAARQIRTDPLSIVIYTIGLGSNGGVDQTFLQRVANDPSSSQYIASQPAGRFYYSPNAGQLAAAFQSIASEILRISK